MAHISAAANSAAGADDLTPRDLKLITPSLAQVIADIMNYAELTGVWPEDFLHTKASFLSKVEVPPTFQDPLKQRILLITHCVYRTYGKIRLRDLTPWVMSWAHPAYHAGLPGKGAGEAWYTAALDKELALLSKLNITGAAVDVFKCFDQILRPLGISYDGLHPGPHTRDCRISWHAGQLGGA